MSVVSKTVKTVVFVVLAQWKVLKVGESRHSFQVLSGFYSVPVSRCPCVSVSRVKTCGLLAKRVGVWPECVKTVYLAKTTVRDTKTTKNH